MDIRDAIFALVNVIRDGGKKSEKRDKIGAEMDEKVPLSISV